MSMSRKGISSLLDIPFLDILIKRNNDEVWMDIYHKPTDTRRCVPFSSNHPNHCKRNIPFSLARRICTISEKEEEKNTHLNKLRENLNNQGYPTNLINQGIEKAKSIPLTDLRKPKEIDNNKKILPFITTHNPNNPDIFPIIKSSFNILCQ